MTTTIDPVFQRAAACADLLRARGLVATPDNIRAAFAELDGRPATLRTASAAEKPVDAYAADIARMRVASGTVEFHRARAEQFARIEAEAAHIAAENEPIIRALRDHDVVAYPPPNPYDAGLRALQRKLPERHTLSLTDDEIARGVAPDGYAAGLRALREKQR